MNGFQKQVIELGNFIDFWITPNIFFSEGMRATDYSFNGADNDPAYTIFKTNGMFISVLKILYRMRD